MTPWRLLVVVAALALLPTACAGGEGDSAAAAVRAAPEKAVDAGTSRVAMSISMTGDLGEAGAHSAAMKGTGVYDYAHARGRIEIDLSQLPGVEGGAEDWVADTIIDGETTYMRIPALARLPGVKPWVKIGPTVASGVNVEELYRQMGWDNPAGFLQFLGGSTDELEEVGSEELFGTDTTHYRGTLQLDRVAKNAPADRRDDVRKVMEALADLLGSRTMPFEVWVGDDELVRKVLLRLHLQEGPNELDATVTMSFWDFGVPVSVSLPPADDVMSESEFNRALAEG